MSGGESADGGPTETANRDGETPVVEVAETTDETTVTDERVAAASLGPVLVVRDERKGDEDAVDEAEGEDDDTWI